MQATLKWRGLLLVVGLSGCATPSTKGGALLEPGMIARLDVLGRSPELTIHNASAQDLPIQIAGGANTRRMDLVLPGETRWWNPRGPCSFWLLNHSAGTIEVRYQVKGADVAFQMPAAAPSRPLEGDGLNATSVP